MRMEGRRGMTVVPQGGMKPTIPIALVRTSCHSDLHKLAAARQAGIGRKSRSDEITPVEGRAIVAPFKGT